MDARISFVTLAVDDLPAARRFYVEGLGWPAELDVPGEVVMIRVGERQVLSLWDSAGFEGEVGPVRRGPGIVPVTLAHNVATPAEVEEVLDLARRAGASEVGAPQARDWGGFTGYFADPAGFRWEVAVNPGPIGQSVLPAAAREEVRPTPFGPVGPEVPGWVPPRAPEPVRLSGAHCTIEPLAIEHAEPLFAELGGEERAALWTYMGEGPFTAGGAFADHVADRVASEEVHVLVRDADGAPAGLAALLRAEPAHGCVELGSIVLGPRLRRTTAATEALSLLMGHVFDLGYRRLEWKCDTLNAASRRAAERLGLGYEGTFARHRVVKGRSRDTAWFALTAEDWPRVRAAHAAWLDPANFVDGRQRHRLVDLLAAG